MRKIAVVAAGGTGGHLFPAQALAEALIARGWGILLALGVLGVGMIGVFIAVLLWRAFCEFYVTIFKISEDLHVLRQDVEAERARLGK